MIDIKITGEEDQTVALYDFNTIEELIAMDVWPHPYNAVIGILPYIRRLKGDNITGIEIGTERGESAYLILEKCPNVAKLYTIDPYAEYENWNGTVAQKNLDKFKDIASKNLLKFGDRCEQIHLPSNAAIDANGFNKNSMDFVFIDGSVNEDDYFNDLSYFYEILRPGGLFAGHNYQLKSVRDALARFREDFNIRIPVQRTENMTYFWTKM